MLDNIINRALEEDIGSLGDITTRFIFNDERIKFNINSREDFIFAGENVVCVFLRIFQGKDLIINTHVRDGSFVTADTCLFSGEGSISIVLSIERTLLNFLQRTSGIASMTNKFVTAVAGTKAVIRSTRKTCPGLRAFDLYAVHVGGGESFRTGLFDGVMIKDNHIACGNGITECVKRIRTNLGNVLITVECDTIAQVEESLSNNVCTVLLDNMSIEDIKTSVSIVNGRAKVEVSGGVNLDNVKQIANCGVDYISIGCITNSVPCKDIGLDVVECL